MREPLKIRYIMFGATMIDDARRPVPSLIYTPNNLKDACEIAGITIHDARGPSKSTRLVYRRWLVMAILRHWGRSMTQIGRALNRDHTTVVHGLQRWNLYLDSIYLLAKNITPPFHAEGMAA